jgi:hypothetical protein
METRMKKILAGLAAGAALAVLFACLLPAGDGVCLNTDGNDTCGTITAPPDTNLALIVNQIFAPSGTVQGKCSSCHAGSAPSGSLNLSSLADAQSALFVSPGVPRTTFKAPTVHPIYRVKPGSPDSSYLYQKVTGVFSSPGKAAGDARMPLGGPYLSADKIALLKRWIELGAPIE